MRRLWIVPVFLAGVWSGYWVEFFVPWLTVPRTISKEYTNYVLHGTDAVLAFSFALAPAAVVVLVVLVRLYRTRATQ